MDHALVIQGFTLALAVAMVLVIVSDAVRYTIPNWLNAAILGLYVVSIFVLPTNVLWAVAAAGIVLAVGLGLFALGLMGGGDVKLLAVLTLWTGWGMPAVQFMFLTAVAGGVLVVIVLLLRVIAAQGFRNNPTRVMPRLLTPKQPVPYGLAIAAAFLWLLVIGGVPALA
jgi:prepilin peptidase CpaA